MARRSTAVDPEGTHTMISGRGEAAAVVDLADEMLDHFLGDFEVGDDSVAQRAAGGNVTGGAAEHHLGLLADGYHLFLASDIGDGDDAWFGQDDAAALDVDERVGGAEIDGHVG